MPTEGFKRKLTTIFSADVAGYSRLMGEDEAATVSTIELYRKIMSDLITQHRGRVIDSPGDNLLAEFGSIVDAVQCAVAVQKELQARNAGLPEDRKMEFRIGINLGDVIDEGDRIYGDGLNIAARLEGLADPAGICISKTVFEQIETKLPLGYEYLGEQTVKNIAKPVGAYRVLMDPRVTVVGKKEKTRAISFWRRKTTLAGAIAVFVVAIVIGIWQFYLHRPSFKPASLERMAHPLPDNPSIAVLPFTNMSEDSTTDYFSDGLTEEIVTALSKVPKLFVISRTSTFTYKGKPIKVQQVSEELGVRYILEGSVRKEGNRVRITAQLIDAIKGHHLWAERYDSEMKDTFALQDKITMKIITAMNLKLTEGQSALFHVKGTENLEAYQKWLQAHYHYGLGTPDDNFRAMELAKEVVKLDPNYPRGYTVLAKALVQNAMKYDPSESPEILLEQAREIVQKALSIDDSDPLSYVSLGRIYHYSGQYDKAIVQFQHALAINPNLYEANNRLGNSLRALGKLEEALPYIKKSLRLNPLRRGGAILGITYYGLERHEEAISALKESIRFRPNHQSSHVYLAASYMALGREEEARAEAEEVLRINPEFSLEIVARLWRARDPVMRKRFMERLGKAGIPEKSPSTGKKKKKK
jgi:TolB-like protein/class 3 adenylate cyclase/Tfp pilus assembly protein PilF